MLKSATLLARMGIAVLTATTAACTSVAFFLVNAPTALGSFDRRVDQSYGDGPRQRLDTYSPREMKGRPIVIFWYGGSWQNGRKSDYRFVGAALAQKGYVVVIPDYRLHPEVKFPTFLEDAAHAVAWVQHHAQEFGGDPQRIVLMGHSAGAHMAAFLALNHDFLTKGGADPRSIKGLIGLSGPYALDPNSDLLRTIFSSPYTKADWQPVQFVDDRSPPVLLFHGGEDKVVEVPHTEKLRDALRAQQIPVDAQIVPGRKHADTVAAFAFGARHRAPVLERSVRFIESVTASPPSSWL